MLSDADKRAAYDRYGHAGLGGQGFGASPFAGGVDIGDIFGDLFGEMFNMGGGGQGGRASRQQRGDDLRFDLTIEFEDAIFGVETEIKIRRLETCGTCKGRGSASGRGPAVCSHCQGRGQLRYQQGFFQWREPATFAAGAADDQRSVPDVPRRRPREQPRAKLHVKVPQGS